jgi:hypothetical protein
MNFSSELHSLLLNPLEFLIDLLHNGISLAEETFELLLLPLMVVLQFIELFGDEIDFASSLCPFGPERLGPALGDEIAGGAIGTEFDLKT